MALDRRSVLKGAFAAGAASVAGSVASTPAHASEAAEVPADAVGLLYDSTKCIGCQTCVVACQEANELEPDTRLDPKYNRPIDLNDRAKTVIKLFKDDDGRRAFFKAHCMHCVDPGCVNACMMGAYQKRDFGVITWDPDRCIGCRYCEIACAFGVPKMEWHDATPRMIKCEMCTKPRLSKGLEPACTDVCPTGAVIFGKREELLADAKQRIADHPGRYQDHVYGETEGGGTQSLYLAPSNVDFTELGLPDLGDEPTPKLARTVQHTVYKGFIAPAALYGVLGFVLWKNRRQAGKEQEAAKLAESGEEDRS